MVKKILAYIFIFFLMMTTASFEARRSSHLQKRSFYRAKFTTSLRFHEKRGGHTIARHVAKSKKYLLSRFSKKHHLRKVSSFFSLAVAQKVVDGAIRQNIRKFNSWLSGKFRRKKLILRYRNKGRNRKDIGKVFFRNGREYVTKKAKVVLVKNHKMKFLILTAYPE